MEIVKDRRSVQADGQEKSRQTILYSITVFGATINVRSGWIESSARVTIANNDEIEALLQ